jgi:short-subunit dehydrogenase involved in D-alanine esterification of teichoic acids
MYNFHSTINVKQVVMHLKEHNIVIAIDSGPSNLPMVWDPSVSADKQKLNWFELCLEVGVL